jgi:hypothetical protein
MRPQRAAAQKPKPQQEVKASDDELDLSEASSDDGDFSSASSDDWDPTKKKGNVEDTFEESDSEVEESEDEDESSSAVEESPVKKTT